jgi:hypothetical protein
VGVTGAGVTTLGGSSVLLVVEPQQPETKAITRIAPRMFLYFIFIPLLSERAFLNTSA